jgi:DNA polymerase-3 subunit epsilon
VDLETTGMVSNYNRITEIGAVKLQGNKVVDTFQTLINPERSIPQMIQGLTGITNDMVKDAPLFEEIAEKFLEFVKDSIFVAHNVSFDYSFLQNEYSRLELNFVRPFICTKAGMKKHFPDLHSYGLKNLCDTFSITLNGHHRALNDAMAAAELLKIINQKRSIIPSQT